MDAAKRANDRGLAFVAGAGECYAGMSDRVIKFPVEPLATEDRLLFERAFREHYPALIAFVRHRVGSDAEAADIAQEASLRVLRYRDRHDQNALKALLFQIAVNLIGMRMRAARVQHWAGRVPIDDEHSIASTDPPPDRQAAGQQELNRLLGIIDALPKKCRAAFVLNRLHGLSFTEVAARLGISAKMVEKHVYRGLAACRRQLGGERS